jgi:Ig-like domain-containing protein/putative pyrroloquinoline-quinone binding quinoprotein
MKRWIEFCAVAGGLLPAAAFAQLQPSWVRGYDSPLHDFAAAIVLDGQSNICVAGTAAGDFLTIKYAPDGTQLWAQRFGDSGEQTASALAADDAGQVWITGTATTNGLLTVKYATDGALLWVRRVNQTTMFPSQFAAIALDPLGNAYVGGDVGREHIVVKYSAEGDELWLRRYAVPDYFVLVKAVALDDAGNVVAAGDVHTAGGVAAFLTLKYDSGGKLLWVARDDWNGSNNFLTGMGLDSDSNVYLTGSSHLRRHHLLTAKYSPAGRLLWVAARRPTRGYHAVARALKVDSQGNAIITGYETQPVSEDDDSFEIITVKYDPGGTELWSARSTFQRTPRVLAVDSADNIYVGGCADCDTQSKPLFLKYAPNGSQVWETTSPSGLLKDFTVDQTGNVYVADDIFAGDSMWAVETRKFVQTANPSQVTAVISPSVAQGSASSNVTFSAIVSGPGPFTYQWRRFGYTLSGETNPTLTISNVQPNHHGYYTVAVSNAVSYTISAEARLIFVPRIKSISRSTDHVVITWEGPIDGLRLQSSSSPGNDWMDIPDSEGRTSVELPIDALSRYFRLAVP